MDTSTNNPFFSVCIPTYNTAKFIGEAIESVLQQTFTDFEIVVSDNCSTDTTEEIVAQFKNDKIRYVKNAHNLGAYPNVSLSIERARGRYVKILCADDKLSPLCLQVIYEQLKKHEFKPGGVSVGYTSREQELQTLPGYECKTSLVNKSNFFDYINSRVKTNLGGFLGSMCASREIFKDVGYFGIDPNTLTEDIYTWKKIVLATDCLLIDQPILYYFRTHEAQGSKALLTIVTLKEDFKFFTENQKLLSSLSPDSSLEIQKFLDVKVGSFLVAGISSLFRSGSISFLFEVLKTMLQNHYYRIPITIVIDRCSGKIKQSLAADAR